MQPNLKNDNLIFTKEDFEVYRKEFIEKDVTELALFFIENAGTLNEDEVVSEDELHLQET